MTCNGYFDWLCDLVNCTGMKLVMYYDLMGCLFHIPFRWTIEMDANREADGYNLRGRYTYETLKNPECPGYCSVLEMMVALSVRCEETIMDNPRFGNRTGEWFFMMLRNLKLTGMADDYFDEEYVISQVNNFLDRNYEPDGTGNIIKIKNCSEDLRTVEIWMQLLWFLDSID